MRSASSGGFAQLPIIHMKMKEKGYHYKERLRHTIVSLCFVILYLWFSIFDVLLSVVICFIGSLIGYSVGLIEWKKIKERIDKRNHVILYYSDGVLYSLLILLFFLQYVSIFTLSKVLESQQYLFNSLVGAFISLCFGISLALLLKIKDYEKAHGKLTTKLFYSRSVSGAEGMISKEGIISSEGKVKVGNEMWNAVSIDGEDISVGETVIIRDIDGLRLVVERIV